MTERNATPEPTREESTTDPPARYVVYRLCECGYCYGSGKDDVSLRDTPRCHVCRGEGRVKEEVGSAPDAAGVGQLLVTLGREGIFAECPMGLLDTEGEKYQKWLVSPWLPSARNISDAGRTLAGARHTKGERT